jgi:RNA polymerase sigma-70 factor (ECF subfamily)
VVRGSERILDEYLVASAVAGDAPALERLIARWQPRLLRHAWRLLGDAELARDAVQEAWIDILRGLARLDDVAAFPAWAFRIVTRRCGRACAHAAAQRTQETGDEAAAGLEDAGTPSGERRADLQRVLDAIRELPAPQRAALSLFHLEDMSVAEIAVALDVPPGTVKTRLMHARRKVRERLQGDDRG